MKLPHPRLKLLVFAVADVFVVFAALTALNLLQYRQASPSTSVSEEQTPLPELPADFTLETQNLQVPAEFATGIFATPKTLNLANDFEISVFAAGLVAPRSFVFDSTGSMFVTDLKAGKVILIRDAGHDGTADELIAIDTGLTNPHGIALYGQDLYVAEETQVVVYREINNLNGSFAQKEVLIPDLPTGGHVTRTIKIGPDQKIYLSTGSSCNVCEESDNRRAAIVRYNLDGTGPEVYASGLRNSVGMQFARAADNGDWVLWTVDNGRDRIGDDIPPEEVNIIGEFGLDFGWPYCYGDQIPNPEFTDRAEYCTQNTVLPSYSLQAHSAPLGITFTPYAFGSRTDFPEYLTSYAFITYHGSWNRSVPTGYKVVMINSLEIGSAAQDFITGWLDENGESWGRPVDIGFGPDGNMYISDDKAGVIYRVSVAGN